MKILFILTDNIYLTPYLTYYTDIMNECKINYDIIYWDKNNNEIIEEDNYFRFFSKGSNKFDKINGYFKFKFFVKKIIKSNSYDFIIPLHMPVYLLIGFYLIKKCKNKYIFDVRDYSFENYYLFRVLEKYLVKNSLINIISSEGYREFLPNNEYYIHHNFINQDYSKYKQVDKIEKPIELSYIGLIRFMDQNKKIINFFKNDERFHLNFVGTNAEKLKDYCEQNGVTNVSLIGTFDSRKTLDLYDKADGILNVYGNHCNLLDYALSNKLYYSAVLYKPILVSPDTFMSKIVKQYNLGVDLDMNNRKELNDLYDYFININKKEYIQYCDFFIDKVIKEQAETKNEIIKRINNERS